MVVGAQRDCAAVAPPLRPAAPTCTDRLHAGDTVEPDGSRRQLARWRPAAANAARRRLAAAADQLGRPRRRPSAPARHTATRQATGTAGDAIRAAEHRPNVRAWRLVQRHSDRIGHARACSCGSRCPARSAPPGWAPGICSASARGAGAGRSGPRRRSRIVVGADDRGRRRSSAGRSRSSDRCSATNARRAHGVSSARPERAQVALGKPAIAARPAGAAGPNADSASPSPVSDAALVSSRPPARPASGRPARSRPGWRPARPAPAPATRPGW